MATYRTKTIPSKKETAWYYNPNDENSRPIKVTIMAGPVKSWWEDTYTYHISINGQDKFVLDKYVDQHVSDSTIQYLYFRDNTNVKNS